MKILDEKLNRATKLELRAQSGDGAELPAGICGRLTGVALVYGAIDDYGTLFAPGCLTKTRADRVAGGKVKLFADHGPFTNTHVGVVRMIDDVGDSAMMVADLFNTEAGRAMKEYLEAVLASGAETGLSIGFRPVKKEWKQASANGADKDLCDSYLEYQEIQLREVSITPVPAVPGTDVTSVRREAGEGDEDLLRRALRNILRALPEQDARAEFDEVYAPSAAKPDTEAAPPAAKADEPAGTPNADGAEATETSTETTKATDEERREAFRKSFA